MIDHRAQVSSDPRSFKTLVISQRYSHYLSKIIRIAWWTKYWNHQSETYHFDPPVPSLSHYYLFPSSIYVYFFSYKARPFITNSGKHAFEISDSRHRQNFVDHSSVVEVDMAVSKIPVPFSPISLIYGHRKHDLGEKYNLINTDWAVKLGQLKNLTVSSNATLRLEDMIVRSSVQ